MKRYEIEVSGHQCQVVELLSGGTTRTVGEFPTAMDASVWLDDYLRSFHSLRSGRAASAASPPTATTPVLSDDCRLGRRSGLEGIPSRLAAVRGPTPHR